MRALSFFIESSNLSHVFEMDMKIERLRQMPTNLQLNINVGFPQGIDPSRIPQQVMTEIHRQLQQSVVDQIRKQSQVTGVRAKKIRGGWRKID